MYGVGICFAGSLTNCTYISFALRDVIISLSALQRDRFLSGIKLTISMSVNFVEFTSHTSTITYIWFNIAINKYETYTPEARGMEVHFSAPPGLGSFFDFFDLVPFKCQEHEVMLASINLVLGGMTILMGKADKHQSVSMGVDCNINTLFLNGQNENTNAQV